MLSFISHCFKSQAPESTAAQTRNASTLNQAQENIFTPFLSSGYKSHSTLAPLSKLLCKIGIKSFQQTKTERQLKHLQTTGVISPFEINGQKTKIAVFDGRPMVLVNVSENLKLPFYISTGNGGKEDVPPGHWYPFFGIGTRLGVPHWFIKASTEQKIKDFYEIGKLKELSSQLDTALGDIRSKCAQEWTIPEGRHNTFKRFLNDSIQNGVASDTARVPAHFATTANSKTLSSIVNKVLINSGLVLQELQRTPLRENSNEEEQATALQALHTSLGRLESLDSVELQSPKAQEIITHIRNQLVLIRPPEAQSELNQRLTELVDTSQTENDSIQNEANNFEDLLTNLEQWDTGDTNASALFHTPIQHIGKQRP